MGGAARDLHYRDGVNRVINAVENAHILEPLSRLARSAKQFQLKESSAAAFLEDMPDLPECCGDASQGGNVSKGKQPTGDLLAL